MGGGRQTTSRSVNAQNADFFAGNEAYGGRVAGLETYRNIRRAIDGELAGLERLVDIGNGGVFDYDATIPGSIVAIDLFLGEESGVALPPNASARQGDALDLPEPDGAFDGALLVMVLHHLVGADYGTFLANVDRALAEAVRVLEPGGRLIVVESCVPPWFVPVERALFAPVAALTRRRSGAHPPTIQLHPAAIATAIGRHARLERTARIPAGRWLLQFGRRWPSALTPARPCLFVARTPS